MLVSTRPGQATLTLTPNSAASARNAVENPTIAHLLVLYGVIVGAGIRTTVDPTLTMWPARCVFMTEYAARQPLRTPLRFTSRTRRQCSAVVSRKSPTTATAALLIIR